jgi:hypothetical protein
MFQFLTQVFRKKELPPKSEVNRKFLQELLISITKDNIRNGHKQTKINIDELCNSKKIQINPYDVQDAVMHVEKYFHQLNDDFTIELKRNTFYFNYLHIDTSSGLYDIFNKEFSIRLEQNRNWLKRHVIYMIDLNLRKIENPKKIIINLNTKFYVPNSVDINWLVDEIQGQYPNYNFSYIKNDLIVSKK